MKPRCALFILIFTALPAGAEDAAASLGDRWSVAVTDFGEPSGIVVEQDGAVRTLYNPRPTRCALLDAPALEEIGKLAADVDLPPFERQQTWPATLQAPVYTLTISASIRLRTTSVSTTNYVLQLTPAGATAPTGLRAAAEKLIRKVWGLKAATSVAACKQLDGSGR